MESNNLEEGKKIPRSLDSGRVKLFPINRKVHVLEQFLQI